MSRISERPRVFLRTDGSILPEAYAQVLVEVRVTQQLSLPNQCELVLADPPETLEAATVLRPGTALQVTLDGFSEPLFEGEVTGLEYIYGPAHELELRVRAYDLLHRLRKRQTVRAHVDVTPQSLAQELVVDLGLVVEASESGLRWRQLIQSYQSDYELLREIIEPCGLHLALRGQILHLLTLHGIGPALPLTLGSSLHEAQFDVNGESACRSVAGLGWNLQDTEAYRERAAQTRMGRQIAFDLPPGQVGGNGQRILVNRVVQNRQHAEALAQAELDRRTASEVTFWGVAEGDPRLRPGTQVEVRGVSPALVGRYVLSMVTHSLDARKGFVSELSTAPPPPQPVRGGASVVLGVVTRVDDPEGLGRIRVSLPTYDDVETDWLQVISLGAGAGKGLMILPDRDDRVLVLLTQADLSQGIVLGGLYGANGWPDAGVEGAAVRRFTLRTPGGQWLRFNDVENAVHIGDGSGSYIELSPQRVRVHAATDLELEAPGHSVVIRGQAIDFERG